MSDDQLFRWPFIAIFVGVFSISGYFRSRARRSGEAIPRAREGKLALLLRMVIAAPLYLSFLAYMVNPGWIAWASVPLPSWLRVLGAVVGFVMLPALYWVVSSIGSNISETLLTKEKHVLVTQGPYRWVRHPLYTVSTVAFISLALLAANWFMMVIAVLAIMGVLLAVIPREEAQLIIKFGDQYREYRTRTGKLLPRLK
jgi:protein-S-isoprenylcysteine O-methyltransferase Ste14